MPPEALLSLGLLVSHRLGSEDSSLSRCWGKGLSSKFLGLLPQSGLLWECPGRPKEGSTLRKGDQNRCQGSP